METNMKTLMDRIRGARAWQIYGGVSLYLVINSVLDIYLPPFWQKHRLMGMFQLGFEMNLAAWWSGISLFLVSLLAYGRAFDCPRSSRKGWLGLALVALALSCDEIGSIHERVSRLGGWGALVPFAVPMLLILLYSLAQIRRDFGASAWFLGIVLAFGLFGLVAGQEFLEHAIKWPEWMGGLRLGLEEGTELVAIGLLLGAVLWVRRQARPGLGGGLRLLLPSASELPYVRRLAAMGLLLHGVAVVWVLPHFENRGGDPAVLFPAYCYFILFALCFWKSSQAGRQARSWAVACVLFLVCSAASVADLTTLLPGLGRLLPRGGAVKASVQFAGQLSVLALAWFPVNARRVAWGASALVGAMLLIALVSAFVPPVALPLLRGLFCFILMQLLVSG